MEVSAVDDSNNGVTSPLDASARTAGVEDDDSYRKVPPFFARAAAAAREGAAATDRVLGQVD